MDKAAWKLARRMRRGFTLGELLVVVAIIGVLVAVAIPTFNYQLEKAREAVDIAHLRQAKSAAVAYFTTNPPKNRISRKYYDVYSGELVEWVYQEPVEAIPLYGKGTKAKGLGLWTENGLKYNDNLDVRDCLIMVTADQDGNICCGWVKPKYAIRADPFTFLATWTDENGKKFLFPTRSASNWNGGRPSDSNLLDIDNDLTNTVNRDDNSEEIEKIYYTLQMYYQSDLDKLNTHNEIKNDPMLALRIELFFGTRVMSVSDDASEGNNFFQQTIFQRLMCDAEAVTIATQFWARIAEFNENDLTKFDTVTGATKALGWMEGSGLEKN